MTTCAVSFHIWIPIIKKYWVGVALTLVSVQNKKKAPSGTPFKKKIGRGSKPNQAGLRAFFDFS
jgi:hypothetical protein